MNREEKQIAIEGVIYLCRCAVNNTVPDIDKINHYNFEHLYIRKSKVSS